MTPTARAALIARLTHAAETVGERVVDVARADLRALLSLLRPVASVEGRVARVLTYTGLVEIEAPVGEKTLWASWPGATVGQRVRVAVHAVEEEG